MPKSSAAIEVVEDSEEEQPKSPKKDNVEDVNNKNKDESGDKSAPENEDEDEDEEEYEIEAILDAKHGVFPGGQIGYFVKWKGYTDEHNSWVNQEDAENARLLIDEFWQKQGKDKKGRPKVSSKARARKSETRDDTSNAGASNKRRKSSTGRKSKSSQPDGHDNNDDDDEEEKPKAKKARKMSRVRTSEDRMDLDGEEDDSQYRPMQKYKEKKSWESLVARVDTIEKVEGNLKVFFTLNNGDKIVESSQECARHFPQKLIQFYESNLRWRESE